MELLRFEFSFHEIDDAAPVGFQLGHLTIHGDHGAVTSKGRIPDQSMMLVISLADLMDGIGRLLSTNARDYEFIGADSSFRIVFRKERRDRVLIIHDDRVIHACAPAELTDGLADSINGFARDGDIDRVATASEIHDFRDAMERFAAFHRS